MQERRKDHRAKSFLGARIAFDNRRCVLDCLVRNLSPDGAKLVFPFSALMPARFDLAIPHRGEERPVKVVWRRREEVGVEFLPVEASAIVSIEAVRRIRALEAERDSLARRVADLTEPL